MKRAVYAGSFDPITLGHLDVVERGARLFDEVIVAIGHNPAKKRAIALDVRLRVLHESLAHLPNVRIDTFQGLTVDYCRRVDAHAILRGLRNVVDFDFEFPIAQANRDMAPEVDTVFLLTEPTKIFVSSSLIKEIAAAGGDAGRYLPAPAWAALREALAL